MKRPAAHSKPWAISNSATQPYPRVPFTLPESASRSGSCSAVLVYLDV